MGMKRLLWIAWLGGFAPTALASMEWNVAKRGQLKGSGCDSLAQDTFLLDAGDQFFVVFSKLEVKLDGGSQLIADAYCTGSIPIAVDGRQYLERVDQVLGYSWSKSEGSTGKIAAHNKWLGRALKPLNVDLESWQTGVGAYEEISSQDHLNWGCKPNDSKKGALDLSFSVLVRRQNPKEESISINLAGHDIRYTAETVWKDCPE